ncbi:DUF262 domain-containing protein [Pseudoalteromonas fuliginea]|uniref:GmrSD restriction endonucleases N-terminal domain-containing protein n=1 Tax=Pseudoalteromonas fuliginea TaxID=1872678 RepID=A0ABD3YAG8_9GAMM|nr:DUF262 domain-containing protein [Pseudoalteromonas fuliginea]KDC51711.1 hypothetical protein DC53_07835 [Pseudoalteromonas fuliginea]KJZ24114.1 hypothetical protein TW82_18465 [Pseudoalteromonas fuliginea]
MISYKVRSISLLNLVNDINKGLLIPDAYFQRNLVWRETHKKDFIKTILLGFPFPEIFISKGKIDVEKMSTVSCIVDGQQRTDAIKTFISNEFDVDGSYYKDLTEEEKSSFLKYEIAVIELDLENDDLRVKEIFQRINRTSNSLTIIEKLASEYSTSEYMLVAKLLTDQIELTKSDNSFKEDPNIPDSFYEWAKKQKISKSTKLFTSKAIFSITEISKKNNLMYILNIMSTVIGGMYRRNDKVVNFLDDFSLDFRDKTNLIKNIENVAEVFSKLKLKSKSYWNNKANFFSLFIALYSSIESNINININILSDNLELFESNLPEDYRLAATEGVNNTSERLLRHSYLMDIIKKSQ